MLTVEIAPLPAIFLSTLTVRLKNRLPQLSIVEGIAQGSTLLPSLFKVFMSGRIVVIEAAKQGVMVSEDIVSGVVFADGFLGVQEYQKDAEANRESAEEL